MITPGSLAPGEDGREAGTHVRVCASALLPWCLLMALVVAVLFLCAQTNHNLGAARQHGRGNR